MILNIQFAFNAITVGNMEYPSPLMLPPKVSAEPPINDKRPTTLSLFNPKAITSGSELYIPKRALPKTFELMPNIAPIIATIPTLIIVI